MKSFTTEIFCNLTVTRWNVQSYVLVQIRFHKLGTTGTMQIVQRITFLGYVISPEGMITDDSKVDAVKNWPVPVSFKDLQQFLGFAKFYRRFIRNYSTLAAPLTSLLKGAPKRLVESSQAEMIFQKLKESFTTAPKDQRA